MTTLKPGDVAPAFSAIDQHGKEISLEALKGKKVILYFYPKDNTPGCTAEACDLRNNHSDLISKGYVVIGVSPDPLKSHTKFTEKYELPFSLLPDTEKTIIQSYGVWGPKKFMGKSYDGVLRTTFVIDEKGLIEKVFTQVFTQNHAAQILEVS
jgi:peroxiredoxin Q/BCP